MSLSWERTRSLVQPEGSREAPCLCLKILGVKHNQQYYERKQLTVC